MLALRHLGVGAVVAVFFSRLFFRNAINLGLPVIECAEAIHIDDGDQLELHPVEGRIVDRTSNAAYQGLVLPSHLLEIIEAGGLVPFLEQRI